MSYSKNLSLLVEKCPKLLFSRCFPKTKSLSFRQIENVDLKNTEVVYIYGLTAYDNLKDWLKQDPLNSIVFIEDDLKVIEAFLHTAFATELLNNKQIFLSFTLKEEQIENICEELASFFVATKIEVIAASHKEKSKAFPKIKELLLRKSVLASSWSFDRLFFDIHFKNFISNIDKLENSFLANKFKGKFKNIPAIVCGAGPSLEKSKEELKRAENRALIIAGGSAICSLTSLGITPHIGIAFDPNEEELERFKNIDLKIPLLYSTRLFRKVFDVIKGPIGYLKAGIGGLSEKWLEEELKIEGESACKNLPDESLSVLQPSIAFAHFIGCYPIILCGADLSYTKGKRYISSMSFKNFMEEENLTTQKRIKVNKDICTTVKWLMEAKSLEKLLKEIKGINATEGGLKLKAIPHMSLKKASKTFFKKELDISKLIQIEIEKSKLHITKEQINSVKQKLKLSFQTTLNLCNAMRSELQNFSGKAILMEMELKEEIAYKYFLYSILDQIDLQIARLNLSESAFIKTRWKVFEEIVEKFIYSSSTGKL